MTISTVKRLAADIFDVGQNKVRISPDGLKEAEGALTRADVKGLIEKGIITKLPRSGRASARKRGRRGHGHRKGHPLDKKEVWMEKVRAQRRFLSMLVQSKALKAGEKGAVYRKVKSGIFRNKKAMLLYLKENKLVAQDYEPAKAEFRKPEPKTPKRKAGKKEESKAAPKAEQNPERPREPEHKAAHAAHTPAHEVHPQRKGEQK